MQLEAFLAPLPLTVAAIVSVFVVILMTIDTRRSRHRNFLRKLMTAYVSEKSAKQFSVVVELDRSADAVWPVLQHLSDMEYRKLQVIVLVRHTAGKRALESLRRYQRAHRKELNLSVVKHRKGMDHNVLLRRHAKGELVMWMDRETRLSPDFFRRMSLEFLDTSLDAAGSRQVARPDDTLASAVMAWNVIVRDLGASFFGSSAQPVVYRKSSFLKDNITHIRRVNEVALISPVTKSMTNRFDWLLAVSLLVILSAVTVASYLLLPRSWYFVAGAAIGGAIVTLGLHMTSFHYHFGHKLTLLLFLPFWPFMTILSSIGRALRRLPVFRRAQAVAR